jgi:hypothetical protein
MKHFAFLLLAGMLLNIPTSAQWSAGAYLGTLLDDNAFNNAMQLGDRITELSLQTAYGWETDVSDVQLFYTGTGNFFTLVPSRTFYEHSTGMTYSQLLGANEATLLKTGGSFSIRSNRDEYTVYDHSQLALHLNMRHYLSDLFMLKGGYSFRSAWFAELSDFNYAEHVAFLQGAVSLPTKTTVMLQADLDYKKYMTPNADSASVSPGGSGKGKQRAIVSTPGVTQLIGTLKIAQGVAQGTGISLTGQYQVSLEKELRYLTFSDGRLTDDELFDDHYGYEGPLGSLLVTQLLPADIRLLISGTVQQRRYSDRPAYDLAGVVVAPQRIDNRFTFSVSIDTPIESLGLRLTLIYDHIINASNDSFYDYRNNAVAARISFAY